MDEAPDAGTARGAQYDARSFDVAGKVGSPVSNPACDSGAMDDRVASDERTLHGSGIQQIATRHFDAELLEPGGVGSRTDERADTVACSAARNQALDEMATEEAGGARDQERRCSDRAFAQSGC